MQAQYVTLECVNPALNRFRIRVRKDHKTVLNVRESDRRTLCALGEDIQREAEIALQQPYMEHRVDSKPKVRPVRRHTCVAQ